MPQPLTQEQFQKAKDAGYSLEKIIEFEKQRLNQSEKISAESESIQEPSVGNRFGKFAGLVGKGAYFGIPSPLRLAMRTAAEAPIALARGKTPLEQAQESEAGVSEILSRIQPEGVSEKVAEAIGSFIPFSQFVKPFSYASRTLPLIRKAPGIIKSLATGAGYGGTKAALEGEPIIPEAISSAGQFGAFHLGGKLGATLGKFAPKAIKGGITKRIASAVGGGAAGAVTSPEEPEVGAVFGAGLGALYPAQPFGKTIENLDRFIDTSIEKSIRPSIAGKKTYSNIQSYKTRTREAIKTIYQNRENLGLTDEAGEPVKRLPQNLKDLSQAVENTKTGIFKIYNTLARQAGEKGWTFNPERVEAKLIEVSKDFKFSPQIRKYAESIIPEIQELKGVNPEILQERIRELNSSLESYYNNRVDKAKARVDASVANLLRQELDEGVTSLSGAKYQLFKDKYGALKTLEKDLNKRLIIDARKNIKGFFDITDIFSGGQIIKGAFNLDPAQVAAGLTSKGILTFYKWLNNPNRIIGNMFTTIDKVSKGNVSSKTLTKFGKFIPSEEALTEMRKREMKGFEKEYKKEEITLSRIVKENGGIAPYKKKNLAGGLREEYRENIPINLRNKNGLTLDEMAAVLKENYPQFNIENERDLLDILSKEKQSQTKSFGKFKKAK